MCSLDQRNSPLMPHLLQSFKPYCFTVSARRTAQAHRRANSCPNSLFCSQGKWHALWRTTLPVHLHSSTPWCCNIYVEIRNQNKFTVPSSPYSRLIHCSSSSGSRSLAAKACWQSHVASLSSTFVWHQDPSALKLPRGQAPCSCTAELRSFEKGGRARSRSRCTCWYTGSSSGWGS